MMVEKIEHANEVYAILIRKNYRAESIEFFSPEEFPQQIGYMNRPKGYHIQPHVHVLVERQIQLTQEVLVIRSGKVRVDFYDNQKVYLKSIVVYEGDVILLANGGHGFEMLEDSEMIEIKQGPYVAERDKIRFAPVDNNQVQISE
jgi:hypothetical protein